MFIKIGNDPKCKITEIIEEENLTENQKKIVSSSRELPKVETPKKD
jgi:hypothetical protein